MSTVDVRISYGVDGIVKGGSVRGMTTLVETVPVIVPEVAYMTEVARDAREGGRVWFHTEGRTVLRAEGGYFDDMAQARGVSHRCKGVEDVRFREIHGSGRTAALAEAQAWADRCARYRDVVMLPSSGPVVRFDPSKHRFDWTVDDLYTCDARISHSVRETAHVVDMLRRTGHDAWTKKWDPGVLVVVEPDLVPGYVGDGALVAAARHVFVDALPARQVQFFGDGFLEAWLDYTTGVVDRDVASDGLSDLLGKAGNSRSPSRETDDDTTARTREVLTAAAYASRRWTATAPERTAVPSLGR